MQMASVRWRTVYASERPASAIRGTSISVQRNSANRFKSRIFLSGAALAAAAAASAGNIVGMAPSCSSPQIMLYVSQSLGSHGTSFRVYGLRIEEVRALTTSPQSAVVGSLRRSELIDLRIVPHSQIRIELARRLTWDLTHEAFGTQASPSLGLQIKSISFQDPPRLQPWDPRVSGLSVMGGHPDPQAGGVSVAVAAAVVTLPWTSSAARPVTAASGLATTFSTAE
jgi:hypothetical protein